MSEADDKGRKPPVDDQRTVFVPSQRSAASTPEQNGANDRPPEGADTPAATPDDAPAGDQEAAGATQWEPFDEQPDEPSADRQAAPAPTPETAGEPSPRPQTPIKVGDCLNHIYEVKRFVARGGMGEVFEGVNVTSDERVAIKVMLPSLAADRNVIAMFHREARAMTRLQHEALVQYRLLAQEPQLGILYIVTDYIDGTPLCDVLGTLKPSADQIETLLRRLASGLRAAHLLGVLHRDISPDNVLLESGRIEHAKIVDFGIAKDLTPGSGTIIGEGFAGKLGYVAPEQLGDFNRELGPWTDVYSLGLVMTAAAVGHDLHMGGTLVDAVDGRRKGPDLSGVPDTIRPVLAAMLRANPAERLRSMDEVIAMLDARRAPPPALTSLAAVPGAKFPRPAILGGGAAAILLLGGLTYWMTSSPDKSGGPAATQSRSAQSSGTQPSLPVVAADPVDAARAAIDSIIPSIPCSWLDVVRLTRDSGELNIVLGGVARDPSEAQTEVDSALRRARLENANIDASAVASIEPGGCAAIDAYRQIRNTEAPRLSTKQRMWDMHMLNSGAYKGQQGAQPITTFDIGDSKLDLTLIGVAPSGVIDPIFDSRAMLDNQVRERAQIGDDSVVKLPSGAYQFKLDVNHQGWSGLVLITGKGPFPADIVRPPLGARNGAWQERLATIASERGWKTDMLWFKVKNQRAAD